MIITFKALLIALFALSAVSTILSIGDERKPITRGGATFSVIVNALLILGIIGTF